MKIKVNDNLYTPSQRQFLLYRYLLEHANKDSIVKTTELIDHLRDYGMEVSINTLYNDLDILRDAETFNLQWEYDYHKKGYRLNNPPFEPREIRLLIDSIQASSFLTQPKAAELITKVKKLTDVHTVATLKRPTVVSGRVRSMNDSVVIDADRLYQAIAEDCQIQFKYYQHRPSKQKPKAYSNEGKFVRVSPFSLYWNNGFLYLYAYNAERKRFQFYRVDRMEAISRPIRIEREGKDDYDRQALTSRRVKVFDMYSGPEFVVKMRFSNDITSQVFDQFGKDNILPTPDGEGYFTIRTPIQVSPTFYAWVSTFGEKAKILEPLEVIEGMKDFLQKSLDMYRNDGEM